MLRAVVVLTVLLAVTVVAQSPSRPGVAERVGGRASAERTIGVRGTVVADDTGMALRRVRVRVLAGGASVDPVFTDDEGRFAMRVPDLESFVVRATKAGYAVVADTIRRNRGDAILRVRMRPGAVIAGRVTDRAGAPAIAHSITARRIGEDGSRLFVGQTASFTTMTDDRGEYRFGGLPAGRYEVSAAGRSAGESNGRPFLASGQIAARVASARSDSRAAVTVIAGQSTSRDLIVDGPLARTGVTRRIYQLGSVRLQAPSSPADMRAVEGVVVDDFGEPMEGVSVHVLLLHRERGRQVAARLGAPHETDDRGHYRVFGLPAGTYLVMATAGARISSGAKGRGGYAPTFHPGTPEIARATTISLERGDAIGIGIALGPATDLTVTGLALDSAGRPFAGSIRLATPVGVETVALDPLPIRSAADGVFAIAGVRPGTYALTATLERRFGRPAEYGLAYVTVFDRDPPPVVVRTAPGVTMEGRFAGDGEEDPFWCLTAVPEPPHTCTRFAAGAFSLAAVPLESDRTAGRAEVPLRVNSSGSFSVHDLAGRTAIALRSAPDGWFLKSVTIDGQDVTDGTFEFVPGSAPIENAEVVVSRHGATIAGRVTDASGAPVAGGSIDVFSTTASDWTAYSRRMKTAAVGSDGTFAVKGLPPGEYWVAAVPTLDESAGEWQDADVLASLVPRATLVSLDEGEEEMVGIER